MKVPILIATLLLVLTNLASAQDTITPNPKAVELREIWHVNGSSLGARYFTGGYGTLGRAANGLGAIALWFDSAGHGVNRIYYGDPNRTGGQPDQSIVDRGSIGLMGDFRGDGQRYVLLSSGYQLNVRGYIFYLGKTRFYPIDSACVIDTAVVAYTLDPFASSRPPISLSSRKYMVADLDNDGADELIITCGATIRDTIKSVDSSYDPHPEIWIYKGGPNFQVDTPTVIIRDKDAIGDYVAFTAVIGDVSGDHKLDIITGGQYYSANETLFKFYFSDSSGIKYRDTPVRTFTNNSIFYSAFNVFDVTGDSVGDLFIEYGGFRTCLFRSNVGKDIRVRSLLSTDADETWSPLHDVTSGGFVNDGSRGYQMAMMFNANVYGFSGGPNGPNRSYETYKLGLGQWYNAKPLLDINGDGWDDFLMMAPAKGGGDIGSAFIYAGGPYIPFDSASSSVEGIAVAGEAKPEVFVWPQPMNNVLNIAWHGNMKRTPASFEVVDMQGVLVAHGHVDPSIGAAQWIPNPGVVSGVYILRVLDKNSSLIASKPIRKL